MSCLEAGHILSDGLKKTIFVFLLSQRQSNLKYRQKLDFRNSAKTTRVHSSRFKNFSFFYKSFKKNVDLVMW